MFLASRASCSLAVRAMRACAQGGPGALPPGRELWGNLCPAMEAGEFGGPPGPPIVGGLLFSPRGFLNNEQSRSVHIINGRFVVIFPKSETG